MPEYTFAVWLDGVEQEDRITVDSLSATAAAYEARREAESLGERRGASEVSTCQIKVEK